MLIDIIVLPPANIRKNIAGLNKNLKENFAFKWTVDNKKLIPHISLFHINIKKSKLGEIMSKTSEVLKRVSPLEISFTAADGRYPYIGIKTDKTDTLFNLHKKVIDNLKIFRVKAMPFIHKPKTFLDNQYAKKYGVIEVLTKFNPHITMGSVKNEDDFTKVLDKINSNREILQNFTADTVALAEIDKYWQVKKIIKKLKLI